MIKPFVINPWMLDLADRLIDYALSQGLSMPTDDTWGFLEGLRRAEQDIDRTPSNWLNEWSPVSKKALENAAKLRNSGLSDVVLDLNMLPDDPLVQMEFFQHDAMGNLEKSLASALIEARESGKQAWIKINDHSALPPEKSLLGALRLGASWWCEVPQGRQDWDEFCRTQEDWSLVVLRSSEWNQWVWPWSCLIEQGLRLSLNGKKPTPSRFTLPEGLKDRRVASWGTLGQRVWDSAVAVFPDGGWEDLWIGLLYSQVSARYAIAN